MGAKQFYDELIAKSCYNDGAVGIVLRVKDKGEKMPSKAADRLPNKDLARQLAGYSLTTAEILYRMPDHPSLLQTFLWQDYDLHPRFPRLKSFLDFWTETLDGPLYRIRVAHRRLIQPTELRLVDGEFLLN